MMFKQAFETFLAQSEVGQSFDRGKWKLPIPFLDELEAIQGPLLRRHVEEAARHSDRKAIVFALVWGYPNGYTDQKTTSAQDNLQTALAYGLDAIADEVASLRDYPETAARTIKRLNRVKGISTASTTKIAYFTRLQPREGQCLIFDRQVIRAILLYDYPELEALRRSLTVKLKPGKDPEQLVTAIINSDANYGRYLAGIADLRCGLGAGVDADDVERFLFTLGKKRFDMEDPVSDEADGVAEAEQPN